MDRGEVLRDLNALDEIANRLTLFRALGCAFVTVGGRGDPEEQFRNTVRTCLVEGFALLFNEWLADTQRKLPAEVKVQQLQSFDPALPAGPMSTAQIRDTYQALLLAAETRLTSAREALTSLQPDQLPQPESAFLELLEQGQAQIDAAPPMLLDGLVVTGPGRLLPASGALCWFCNHKPASEAKSPMVKLHGPRAPHHLPQRSPAMLTIAVPMCEGCRTRADLPRSLAAGPLLLAGVAIMAWAIYKRDPSGNAKLAGGDFALMLIPAFAAVVLSVIMFAFSRAKVRRTEAAAGMKNTSAPNAFPLVQTLIERGWSVSR
jgi:hypothetical protein